MQKLLALLLIVSLAITSSAQQTSPLTKQGAAVKRKTDTLRPQSPISVVRIHAREEFGTFVSNDAEGFTFYDVDRHANVSLKYGEVRKIKDGYGGYNSLQNRHTDRTKTLIAIVIIVGVLGGVLAAVAKAKN